MREQLEAYAQEGSEDAATASTIMDAIELRHWLRKMCMCTQAVATDALRGAGRAHRPASDTPSSTQAYEVRDRVRRASGHEWGLTTITCV